MSAILVPVRLEFRPQQGLYVLVTNDEFADILAESDSAEKLQQDAAMLGVRIVNPVKKAVPRLVSSLEVGTKFRIGDEWFILHHKATGCAITNNGNISLGAEVEEVRDRA